MQILRFAEPDYFYGFLLIPVLIVLYWMVRVWKKRALKRFGETKLIQKLIPDYSTFRPGLKFVVLLFAISFIILGLGNPQIGSKLQTVERKGIDIMIAIDVSNSMLAEDIRPNRLIRSRQAVSKLIDNLTNDRIGLVVFAGKAYTQLPITTDYAAAKLFLSTINTDIVPTQGTAIAEAINLSVQAFDDNNHQKAIIIITDGEDHEGEAIDAAKTAAEKDIRVYTIGMGLPEGTPIPAFDRNGNQQGFRKDRNNNTIITKLNERILQQIAGAGNGQYVRANNTQAGLEFIFNEINKLEKTEFDSRVFADYEDRFQYLLLIALALLIVEFLIQEKRGRFFRNVNLFKPGKEIVSINNK
jgi:Ca-activated chloride channel homolog